MKRILFAALMTASLVSSAYAKKSNQVSFQVESNFKNQFYSAENVSWSVKDKFTKATFELNGQRLEAFYNFNGEMLGTSKAVNLKELPAAAKRTLAKLYNAYTVNEAIHFESANEDAYFISAENDKEQVVLKVGSDKAVSIYQVTKK